MGAGFGTLSTLGLTIGVPNKSANSSLTWVPFRDSNVFGSGPRCVGLFGGAECACSISCVFVWPGVLSVYHSESVDEESDDGDMRKSEDEEKEKMLLMSLWNGVPRVLRTSRSWLCSFRGGASPVPGVVAGVATAVIGLGGCERSDWHDSRSIGSSPCGVEDTRGVQLVWPGLGGGSCASESSSPEGLLGVSRMMFTSGPGVSTNSAWGTLSTLALLLYFASRSVTCTSPNSASLLAWYRTQR